MTILKNNFVNFVVLVIAGFINVSAGPQSSDIGNADKIVYPGEKAPSRIATPLQYHTHYYPNHHHHHHDQEDYDENEYDGRSSTKPPEQYSNSTRENEVPVDFVAKLNGVSYTVNDLLLHYVDGFEEDDDFLESRFGEERNNVEIPKAAKCVPELQIVSLVKDDDPTSMYLPSCTRIERCGGCCNHKQLRCRPTEVETVNYQVIKAKYVGAAKLKFVEKIPVAVERHKKCTCGCKVTAEDCNSPQQEYRENECRCVCRNIDEEKKCAKDYQRRLWDPDTCQCKCREEKMCSTGSTFDWDQCKCVIPSIRRRFADSAENKRLSLSVSPLDDYD